MAIGGVPASGKSTLIKTYMEETGNWESEKSHDLLYNEYNKELDLYILGKYGKEETFPGTDRLSMAVQPKAIEWIKSTNHNILFEGDRLFTRTFLDFLSELDAEFKILVLNTKDSLLESRHVSREDSQNETFLKSRETKISNIKSSLFLSDYIEDVDNDTEEDLQKNVKIIQSWFS